MTNIAKHVAAKHGVSVGFFYRYVPLIKEVLSGPHGLDVRSVAPQQVLDVLFAKNALKAGAPSLKEPLVYYKLVVFVKCLQLHVPHYTTLQLVSFLQTLKGSTVPNTEPAPTTRRISTELQAAATEALGVLDVEHLTEALVSACRKCVVAVDAADAARCPAVVVPDGVYAYFKGQCVRAFPFLAKRLQGSGEDTWRKHYTELLGKAMTLKRAGSEFVDPLTSTYQQEARRKFVDDILPFLIADRCTYIDEFSCMFNATRNYGWAMMGDRAVLRRHEQRESITRVLCAITHQDTPTQACTFLVVLPPIPQRLRALQPAPYVPEFAYWARKHLGQDWRDLCDKTQECMAFFRAMVPDFKMRVLLDYDWIREKVDAALAGLKRQLAGELEGYLFEDPEALRAVDDMGVLAHAYHEGVIQGYIRPHNARYPGVLGGALFGHGAQPVPRPLEWLDYEKKPYGGLVEDQLPSGGGEQSSQRALTMDQEDMLDVLFAHFRDFSYLDIFLTLFGPREALAPKHKAAREALVESFVTATQNLYDEHLAALTKGRAVREVMYMGRVMHSLLRVMYGHLGLEPFPRVFTMVGKRIATAHVWLLARYFNGTEGRGVQDLVGVLQAAKEEGDRALQDVERAAVARDPTFSATGPLPAAFLEGWRQGAAARAADNAVEAAAAAALQGGSDKEADRDLRLTRLCVKHRLWVDAIAPVADYIDWVTVDFRGGPMSDAAFAAFVEDLRTAFPKGEALKKLRFIRVPAEFLTARGSPGRRYLALLQQSCGAKVSGPFVNTAATNGLDGDRMAVLVKDVYATREVLLGANARDEEGYYFTEAGPPPQAALPAARLWLTWSRRAATKEGDLGAPAFDVDRWVFREFVRSLPPSFVQGKTLVMDRASYHLYPTQAEIRCNARMPPEFQYFVESELSVLAMDVRERGGGDGAPFPTTARERGAHAGRLRRPALVYLPSYTPQLNPIESYFNVVKGKARMEVMKHARTRKNLSFAILNCGHAAIDPTRALHFFQCAGYRSTARDTYVEVRHLDRQAYPSECVGVAPTPAHRPAHTVQEVLAHQADAAAVMAPNLDVALQARFPTRTGLRVAANTRRFRIEDGRPCPVLTWAANYYKHWRQSAGPSAAGQRIMAARAAALANNSDNRRQSILTDRQSTIQDILGHMPTPKHASVLYRVRCLGEVKWLVEAVVAARAPALLQKYKQQHPELKKLRFKRPPPCSAAG